ncbi:MAG: hypothetical protein K6E98_05645 [Lachnospiraceae bacterium]|nr:hypothetical protein [Lachnospiraceae bacterium]
MYLRDLIWKRSVYKKTVAGILITGMILCGLFHVDVSALPTVTVQLEPTEESSLRNSNSRELARRIWSTMSAFKQLKDEEGNPVRNRFYGLRPEQICALLGNWQQESGLDPTAVEAVMNEPWSIGETKRNAIAYDFITEYEWGNDEINGYFNNYPNIYKAGIGLAQWTDTYTQVYDYSAYSGANITKEDDDTFISDEDEPVIEYEDKNPGFILEDPAEGNGHYEIFLEEDLLDTDEDNESKDYILKENNASLAKENTAGITETDKRNVKPGRNSKLVKYAFKHGQSLYKGANRKGCVWDLDDRIISSKSIKGQWCDPMVQLAYTLDISSEGDARASWLHEWADLGDELWNGDISVNMEQLSDNCIEGWTTVGTKAFTAEHGWNPDMFRVSDNVVGFTRETDTVRPVGDNTGDIKDFRIKDRNHEINKGTDDYYHTPNPEYIKEIEYDEWGWENGKALSTSSSVWNRSKKDESRTSGIYTARKLAFEYAQKSADVAWHGRVDGKHGILGRKPEWNEYSKANGHDFICENVPADIFNKENGYEKEGPYQHYGVIGDKLTVDDNGEIQHNYVYGWIMDADPAVVANERAKEQYISVFKYIYRYHLYRYMTLYYTSQFLAEYEGVPGKALEARQDNALRWFQLWWDSSLKDNKDKGYAEPNIYSSLASTLNPEGVNDRFFKVENKYARTIMNNLE